MAGPNDGANIGSLNVRKSKGRTNKVVEGHASSRIHMKLRFLLTCMALWPKARDSSSGSKQNGSNSTNGKDKSSSKSKSETAQSTPNLSRELKVYSHLRRFSYNELKLATMNFNAENFLGEGGFGVVFKGYINPNGMSPARPRSGIPIAVKTLNQDGYQGHKEWLAEVKYLGELIHPNLVKLVGYCIENEQRLLVYEFMPRGNLERHLFGRSGCLPWSTRLKIMLGAAKGLAFLHEEASHPLIFRDFKPANILLDTDFNAKLSDFGLARDAPEGDLTHVSTRVMGTQGYTAPEYVLTGHLNSSSDVYSFGVVLLEMVTGRRAMDRSRPPGEQNLVKWAQPQIGNSDRFYYLMDYRLQGRFSAKAAAKAMNVASSCLCRDPKKRPLMSDVVQMLQFLHDHSDKASSSRLFKANQAGPSNHNMNKFGLVSGPSPRNVPCRFKASPLNQQLKPRQTEVSKGKRKVEK